MSAMDETVKHDPLVSYDQDDIPSLEQTQKTFWERSWPVAACGFGLFSEGYVQGVSTCPRNPYQCCAHLTDSILDRLAVP